MQMAAFKSHEGDLNVIPCCDYESIMHVDDRYY